MSNEKVILLVEDNPNDKELILRALRSTLSANPVISARDGLEAIQYLFGTGKYEDRDTNDMPAIVLVDLNMPKIDGLEVLRRMRADYRTKLIPVAIFTSSVEEQDLINGYSLGANSYVRKPVGSVEFSEVVRQLVSYWLTLNETPPPGEKIWAHHFDQVLKPA